MKEQRKHERLPISVKALVRLARGETFEGRTRNISFGGTFVELAQPLPTKVGDQCLLFLYLAPEEEEMAIELEGEVRHVHPSGIGFRFLGIEIGDYNRFKKLMILNSPDPERLLDELDQHPGLLPR